MTASVAIPRSPPSPAGRKAAGSVFEADLGSLTLFDWEGDTRAAGSWLVYDVDWLDADDIAVFLRHHDFTRGSVRENGNSSRRIYNRLRIARSGRMTDLVLST